MIYKTMNLKSQGGNSTLSGRDLRKVRADILSKAKRMKEKVGNRYSRLSEESNLDNVSNILSWLAKQEIEDTAVIDKLIETERIVHQRALLTNVRDYEMLDHLISDDMGQVDANDLNSVLLSAIKTTIDMHNILELMSKEYSDPEISGPLNLLAQRELRNKGRIEELYEEFVNKNNW
ncbi:MAG: hypothetical protein QW597_03665 [Thermoplasmataceae archaeon]